MNNKNNIQHPKDVSRFTRWVNELDDKDKNLDPLKRKSKWILITAFLFALFAISFIWFPTGKNKTTAGGSTIGRTNNQCTNKQW